MRSLLDMGSAQSTAQCLRARSDDAVHLREQGLQRLADERIADGYTPHLHRLQFGEVYNGWLTSELLTVLQQGF